MPGITLPAHPLPGGVGLRDLLEAMGPSVVNSVWALRDIEVAPSPAGEALQELSDRGAAVGGAELLTLATPNLQVIDGAFEGREESDDEPWAVVAAVDASAWDLKAWDAELLRSLRSRFPNAKPLPD